LRLRWYYDEFRHVNGQTSMQRTQTHVQGR